MDVEDIFKPKKYSFLSDKNIKYEAEKCLQCKGKPCMKGCPCACDPHSFIGLMQKGTTEENFLEAARIIYANNMAGGICGVICPDTFCQKNCKRKPIDGPINIPGIQAAIINKVHKKKWLPEFKKPELLGKKVAIVGAGPSGLGASAVLASLGYEVTLFEKLETPGGAFNLIPDHRLDKKFLKNDFSFWENAYDNLTLKFGEEASSEELCKQYDAVGVCIGTPGIVKTDVANDEKIIDYFNFLTKSEEYKGKLGTTCAILGGGPVSVDCATTVRKLGVPNVLLFYRRGVRDMPLTPKEREELLVCDTDIIPHTTPKEVLLNEKGDIAGLVTCRIKIAKKDAKEKFPTTEIPGSETKWPDVTSVIWAIGQKRVEDLDAMKNEKGFFGGDFKHGASTGVQAVAGGKNLADQIHNFLQGKEVPQPEDPRVNGFTIE